MKAQLTKLIETLEKLKATAEDKADNSENDDTVDKYEAISAALDEAMSSVQEVVDEFFS